MTTKLVKRPKSHDNCLLCGDTEFGLGLRFQSISDKEVSTIITADEKFQGYTGILHGGFVASLLDSAMCNAIFNLDEEAVTGDMKIKYHKEVPANSKLEIIGRVVRSRPPLFKVEGELLCNGELLASSEARFLRR